MDYFSLLVIGNDYVDKINKYLSTTRVEPYLLCKKTDAAKAHKKHLKEIKKALDRQGGQRLSDMTTDLLKERYEQLKGMSDQSYYESMQVGNIVKGNGDVYTTVNPHGYIGSYSPMLNLPVKRHAVINGAKMGYSLRALDVDWTGGRDNNETSNRIVWKLFKKGVEPATDEEKTIYKNMKPWVNNGYLDGFDNEDDFISYSCNFWTDAVIDGDGNWHRLNPKTEMWWYENYKPYFIDGLDDNEIVSLFKWCEPNGMEE